MPIYVYKGYDQKTGAVRKGRVEADTPKAARTKLKQKDKVIVSEIKEEASLDKVQKTRAMFTPRSVNANDMAIMARQWATLANAHVPLDESIKALTEQVENKTLSNTLQRVGELVKEGKSLADSLGNFPGVFNRLFINMVRAGESSGTLGLVLDRLATYTEKQVQARGQLVSAMTYPSFMIIANMGIVAYLILSLVPKMQKVFVSLKAPLPWYTQMIVGFSEWMQKYWFLVPVMVALAALGFRSWVGTEAGRKTFDNFLLKMPVFGQLILRIQVSRFTQTLSTLLASGVPIIRAIEITKNIITNAVIAEVLENSKIAVQEGKNLGQTIEKSGRFPALVTHMIMTGERTGRLEEMLGHVALAYEAEVQRKIESLISMVEPAMIIFMAGSAGGIIAAVIGPMLSIMNQIR